MIGVKTALSIDVGTSSTRAVVLDRQGNILSQAQYPLSITRYDASRIEQNPLELLTCTQKAITEMVQRYPEISFAGLATQRSSIIAWDMKTGQALSPLISWQDTRVKDSIELLKPHAEEVKSRSGLVLSPHYGAGKMRWLLDNVAEVREKSATGDLCIAPLVSYLLFHLLKSNPYLLDESNAARTQLWNLQERRWDPWLTKLFAIPMALLPEVKPIVFDYGCLNNTNIPLTAVCGDQTAAVNGLSQLPVKTAVINIGTGAFILLPTKNRVVDHPCLLNGILRSDAERVDYLLEATVNGAAAAIEWARKQWCNDLSEEQFHNALEQWLAECDQPPIFLNVIGGLGSPWWLSGLESEFINNNIDCKQAPGLCMAAVIESIVFMIACNLKMMQEDVEPLENCFVSGGVAKLDALCQKLADISGLIIKRLSIKEATALGLLRLLENDEVVPAHSEIEKVFTPKNSSALKLRYQDFISGINKLVQSQSI